MAAKGQWRGVVRRRGSGGGGDGGVVSGAFIYPRHIAYSAKSQCLMVCQAMCQFPLTLIMVDEARTEMPRPSMFRPKLGTLFGKV